MSQLLRESVKISGAGRTDAGVHATGQVISFSTTSSFPFERLVLALNSALPSDVKVRDCAIVPSRFSARFSAGERSYIYAILNRPAPSALLRARAYHVWSPLDDSPMRHAGDELVGEHDFRAFCATLPESGVTVRTVRSATISVCGELLRIEIAADGFLHHMVRTIVGTLVECGRGKRDPNTVGDLLRSRDRAAAGHTAPAHGLYLAGVRYGDGYDSFLEPPVFGRR